MVIFSVAAVYSLTFALYLFIYSFILFSFTPNDNEIKFKAKVRKKKESLPVASLIISLKATKR